MEKRFKNGLVLGKFMPVHTGHMHLIRTASQQCENVFVLICSLEKEPIAGYLRYQWLRTLVREFDNVRVIHCEDENPLYPHEANSLDEFYKTYWVPSVYKRIKELDVVFTSEDYGDEFAEYLGVQHVLVDKDRKLFPVSGTLVRNNPFDYWDFVPQVVRPYFSKKICLMGPESVGKSTMIDNLTRYFGSSHFVHEYGRTYTEENGTSNLTAYDFDSIAMGHATLIHTQNEKNTGKCLFIDTEAITTKVFGEKYLGTYESVLSEGIIAHQKFDLIILLAPDVPWVNDGTREFPEGRDEHFIRLYKLLKHYGFNFTVIMGEEFEHRTAAAIAEVEKLFKLDSNNLG